MRNLAISIVIIMLFCTSLLCGQTQQPTSLMLGDTLSSRREVVLTIDGIVQERIHSDLDSAKLLYIKALASDSTYSPALYHLSSVYQLERSDSAVYYARKAYLCDTLNKWYIERYASSSVATMQVDQALELYAKLISVDPNNLESYRMKAALHQYLKDFDKGVQTIDSAQMRLGYNPYMQAMKIEMQMAAGKGEQALASAHEMVENNSEQVEPYLTLAQIQNSLGQDTLALESYAKAMMIDSTNVMLVYSLIDFHQKRKDIPALFAAAKLMIRNPKIAEQQKVAFFNELVADKQFYRTNFFAVNELASELWLLYPQFDAVIELYTNHLLSAGMIEDVSRIYKQIIEENPATKVEHYNEVIGIETYLKHRDTVEIYATKAIEQYPEQEDLRLSLARYSGFVGDTERAIGEFKDALKHIKNDTLRSTTYGNIGDSYQMLETKSKFKRTLNLRRAERAYKDALDCLSDNILVLNNYAYMLVESDRDIDRAFAMSSQVIEAEDSNPTYLDTYAWILYKLGRYAEAKKIMQRAIPLDSAGSADIQFHYAEILAALGEKFMAEIYYEKAQKSGYNTEIINQKIETLKQPKQIDNE